MRVITVTGIRDSGSAKSGVFIDARDVRRP